MWAPQPPAIRVLPRERMRYGDARDGGRPRHSALRPDPSQAHCTSNCIPTHSPAPMDAAGMPSGAHSRQGAVVGQVLARQPGVQAAALQVQEDVVRLRVHRRAARVDQHRHLRRPQARALRNSTLPTCRPRSSQDTAARRSASTCSTRATFIHSSTPVQRAAPGGRRTRV